MEIAGATFLHAGCPSYQPPSSVKALKKRSYILVLYFILSTWQ